MNIYRLDDDNPKPIEVNFDTITEFASLDDDPDEREQLILHTFGNYVITLCKINKKNEITNQSVSFRLDGGSDFGERALITNEPRSATVMTVTPTDLLVVDREVFNRYVIKRKTNKRIDLFDFNQ